MRFDFLLGLWKAGNICLPSFSHATYLIKCTVCLYGSSIYSIDLIWLNTKILTEG